MDSVLKGFLEQKKCLVSDTKIPSTRKQKTIVPKASKSMLNEPVETCPYKRMANSVIKDKPSKKDLVEKIQAFITSEEAKL